MGTAALNGLALRLPAAELSDFKLGVTTDEIDKDLRAAIQFLKRFDLKYAEIRGLWGKYNTSQPVKKIRHAKKLLDENSIHVCILDTAFFKVPLPPETAAGNQELDKQWALLKDGYQETLSLETHFMIDGSKAKASEFSIKGLLAAIAKA